MNRLTFNVRQVGDYISLDMKHDNYEYGSLLDNEEVRVFADYLEHIANELFDCIEVTDEN